MTESKAVLLFGGTGFVGGMITKTLVEKGYTPIVITRSSVKPEKSRVYIQGNLDNPLEITKRLTSIKPFATIYLTGIIKEDPSGGITYKKVHFEWVKAAMEISEKIGAKRFLLMSANGAKHNGTPYQSTKFQAEQFLKKSDLTWTIFRPSVILDRDDRHMNFLGTLAPLVKLLIVPVFGNGIYSLSPVTRGDVAEIFSRALENPKTNRKIYAVGGVKKYTYNQLLKGVAKNMGRKILLIHIPLAISIFLVRLIHFFPFSPITPDQLTMLTEGNTVNEWEIWKDLDLDPSEIEEVFSKYRR